jgi:hypothetical protein
MIRLECFVPPAKKKTPHSPYQGHTNATQIHAILWSWTDYPGYTLAHSLLT